MRKRENERKKERKKKERKKERKKEKKNTKLGDLPFSNIYIYAQIMLKGKAYRK